MNSYWIIKKLPKGTRLEASGGFDNSEQSFQSDPKATVRWGDQSWEEMMVGFFEVAFDPKLEIANLVGSQAVLEAR